MKIEIYVGLGYRADGSEISEDDRVLIQDEIGEILLDYFPGYTRIPANGAWHGIREVGEVYVVLYTEHDIPPGPIVRSAAEKIRHAANQSCVAVNITKSDVMFI